MRLIRKFILFTCLWLFCSVSWIHAQELGNRPSRAIEAVNALQMAKWEPVSDGMALLQVSTALGTKLTALKLSADQFNFSVSQQNRADGERASSVLKRLDGDIVVNGGFFGIDGKQSLFPVGLLVDDGVRQGSEWRSTGGFLVLDKQGSPSILVSGTVLPDTTFEAIQSRPVLIEKGGKWAMRTNGTDAERRTLFCLLPNDEMVLLLVSGSGLTLFEAGWLMRSTHWGGYFDCDSAIALDGGGSTQLSVKGRPDLTITGLTPVQNLLVVSKR